VVTFEMSPFKLSRWDFQTNRCRPILWEA